MEGSLPPDPVEGTLHPDPLEPPGPASGTRSLAGVTVHGARLAIIGYAASQLLLFVAYLVLARLITPTDFGQYAAAGVVTGVSALFAESGMLSALITRRDRIDEAASTAFFSLLVSGLALTAFGLAVAPLQGSFFHSDEVARLAAALSGILLLSALTIVPDALLQKRFSFARRVAADPLGAIAFAAAGIVAGSLGAGAWALVAATYASTAFKLLVVWVFVRWRPRRRQASLAMWRELARFARPVVGSEILRRIAAQIDVALLGRFHGAPTLGQYRNGQRLAQQPSFAFVDVISYVLLPAFAHISDEPERLAAVALRVLGLGVLASLPVSIATLLLGEPLAVVLLGHTWRPAGHALAAMFGLTVGGVLISVCAELFKAVNRPGMLVRMHTVGLISLAVSVGATAIPFGLIGVAAAVSFSSCLTGAYGLVTVVPLLGLRLGTVVRQFRAPAIACVPMGSAMLAFTLLVHPAAHGTAVAAGLVVVEAIGGAAVYLGTVLLLEPRRGDDLRALVARRG